MEPHYAIRTATRSEIDTAVEWAAAEGWNPGLYDADCYHAADPDGFLIGLLGDEPIATISAIRYGQGFGFLGFYIVHPSYRGRGYGMRIWRAALKQLAGRRIGLDGVVAQQENYKVSGFALAHRNRRYEGRGGGASPAPEGIVELSTLPFEQVASYDRSFFPDDRSRLLHAWIHQPDASALGMVRGGRLTGYGVMRTCRSGSKIGPLFADSTDVAEALFLALRATVDAGQPVYLDTPEDNEAAVALAEHHNMKVVFETARMYTGQHPSLPLERTFGITSFEVG